MSREGEKADLQAFVKPVKKAYLRVVQDFFELPKKPTGGYDDLVCSLKRAFRSVESLAVDNPVLLFVERLPIQGPGSTSPELRTRQGAS